MHSAFRTVSVWEAEAGQPTGFTMILQHPAALRAMFLRPSETTLGQAYIYDDFDIEGNMKERSEWQNIFWVCA